MYSLNEKNPGISNIEESEALTCKSNGGIIEENSQKQ